MAAVASSAVLGARGVVANRRTISARGRTASKTRVKVVVTAMARETDPKKRVVVTGMGLVSCFGNDYEKFYDKLLAGTSGVGMIDRFDTSDFPTKFAAQIRDFDNEGIVDKKNARRMDDCLQYALVAGNKALMDAGLDEEALEKLDKTRVGVLAGSGMGGLTVFQDGVKALVEKGPKKITPFFIPYAITNMGGALLAIEKGFMGPNYSISTACATANYAFHSAANHIRKGEADIMIAGGVEAPIIPVGLGGFVACRALSSNTENAAAASRPWDKGRDGFVMGEGAGVLVMESLAHAKARGANILAEYLGGGISTDAYDLTAPRADGRDVILCMRSALADARIDASEVDLVNAHGTSTPVGDLCEVAAINAVFGDRSRDSFKINSTKSMLGHQLGASGALEAIACLQSIRKGAVHPTINHEDPEEGVAFDVVPNEAQDFKVKIALSNSFGFGGHNSSVVFGEFK